MTVDLVLHEKFFFSFHLFSYMPAPLKKFLLEYITSQHCNYFEFDTKGFKYSFSSRIDLLYLYFNRWSFLLQIIFKNEFSSFSYEHCLLLGRTGRVIYMSSINFAGTGKTNKLDASIFISSYFSISVIDKNVFQNWHYHDFWFH